MIDQSDNLFLHADGDSFFVACELSTRPELRGKPVIVGGDRGIAVAMSPEAKALGITRGMPVFRIKKIFPEVIILDHHFDLYRDISNKMRQILSKYCMEVEVYSIDECFALVQPFEAKYHGGGEALVRSLKAEIENTLGVTYSFGLARTKSLAKQASKLEKPGGVVILFKKADEMRALKSTDIGDVWGIGRRTLPDMLRLGIKTAYDFINISDTEISKRFSKSILVLKKDLGGEQLMQVESKVDPRDQKSIQSTSTFHPTSADPKIIKRELAENAEHACANAREIKLFTNKIAFFIKTTEFKYYFDEEKLSEYTSDSGQILKAIEPKLSKMLSNKHKIRATGIILQNLIRQENAPRDLFGGQDVAFKNLAVEEVADRIRAKFGGNAIRRVSSLRNHKK